MSPALQAGYLLVLAGFAVPLAARLLGYDREFVPVRPPKRESVDRWVAGFKPTGEGWAGPAEGEALAEHVRPVVSWIARQMELYDASAVDDELFLMRWRAEADADFRAYRQATVAQDQWWAERLERYREVMR